MRMSEVSVLYVAVWTIGSFLIGRGSGRRQLRPGPGASTSGKSPVLSAGATSYGCGGVSGSVNRELGPGSQPEFVLQRCDMLFERALGEVEPCGDLPIRQTQPQQRQHLSLARRDT